MSETLFIVGREPALSVAELEAVASRWTAEVVDVQPAGVLLRHIDSLPHRAIDQLGGSLKQVSVVGSYDLEPGIMAVLDAVCTPTWLSQQFPEGRIEFGVSVYGWSGADRARVQRHFLGLKKKLHGEGRVTRFVASREPQMSAVTVHRNGLDKRGKEFVFFRTSQSIVLGVTIAVQDYQAYAVRDFGRPAADPKSGMLPPKVAQIMLNIAQANPDDVLLDPFCGSGTVLQEAALLGVKEIHGSDTLPKAVKDSQENLRWLMKEFPELKTQFEIIHREVTASNVKPTVIVTEPWLGKPLHGRESRPDLERELSKVEQLLRKSFRHWKNTLKPGGRVVMVWPAYVHRHGNLEIDLERELLDLGFQPQPLLSENAASALQNTHRNVLEYSRPDARVRRQIRKWAKG